ncbi:hypothetical protein SSBR45G_03780 [Bradyrhizobium sp. SSBR45G]|uniref:autotransporter outer membrane beta-barrel domain-containing protein n=1 Tax=unclassified Bradyrhizobium TaxID=2631580 RepID=UPI002342BC47|nr:MULTISPECIES: autotransporter outer membrane beta-barrel domain-containing protein [unclassified Bradyrhizobium]GLH75470.1 hypothetical protein SSBR45G_03780 [Bradyrhizobium sp. SSBR45G]GLH82743.1 hypothetical protein SSBR45R_02030 [Bradyrhizobium sp. SSBR45R]
MGWLLLPTGAALAQQCQATGTNQTCSNSIALTGGATGLEDSGTATVTNAGAATISGTDAAGTGVGLSALQDAKVTNFGTISGSGFQALGVAVNNDATIANSGVISAISGPSGVLGYGLYVGNDANVTNSGTITGSGSFQGIGILAFRNANVTNSGTISGAADDSGSSYGIVTGQDARVTNVGTISAAAGFSGVAFGIQAQRDADVTNSGSISAVAGVGGQAFGLVSANGNVRLTNSGTLSAVAGAGGQSYGLLAVTGMADVANSGTISGDGGQFGLGLLAGQDATVANSGTITARGDQQSIGISAGGNASVTNSGSIASASVGTGFSYGIAVANDANVSNFGTIASVSGAGGRGVGISVSNNASIFNTGSISGAAGTGGQGFGIQVFGTANVTNAGTVSGSTSALQFAGGADTLTLLTGSRLIGAIELGGGGDTVNFRGGNHNLTFDTLSGATVTGTTPFAVSGNRAVAVDPTTFAATARSLGDFSRAVFDAVPVFTGTSAPGGGPLAFAAPDSSSRIDEAFAAMPGLSAYAGQGLQFKNPTVTYGDGSTVWARGFAGQRIQQQDGVLLRTTNLFYGGMIGGDWQTRPGLRLGAFLGGGQTRSAVDFNQGSSNADLVFGGAYARYDIGASFLHAAVQAGSSRNSSSRTINNNLVAGGLETASANFNGWYVSPQATFGHRWALGSLAGASYTLTPSVRLRYLYGSYAGTTETGTTAPLTLNGQTVSTLEERGEAKLTRSVTFSPGDVLSTSLTAGVLGTQRVGGNSVNAALLGQTIPFATPGQSNVWGGFGGLGLEWQNRNLTLFSAGEYLALSDRSTIISGRAGLRIAF